MVRLGLLYASASEIKLYPFEREELATVSTKLGDGACPPPSATLVPTALPKVEPREHCADRVHHYMNV